jgi:proteasome lid subunit RPN8/RPN11
MEANHLSDVIRSEGALRYPEEACGLVIKVGPKSLAIPCTNISDAPTQAFMISTTDWIAASKQGEVIGVWHTHVEIPAVPSDADRASCEATAVPWYIVSVRKSEDGFAFSQPTMLQPVGFLMPYLERPYVAGVFDCFSLLRDYFQREYGIEINDYPRIETDGSLGRDKFIDRFAQEGFTQLIDQEPIPGDVFLLQMTSSVPEHIAIYIGDDMILHHCHGRLSRRDIYGGYWAKHTTHHLRNKALAK